MKTIIEPFKIKAVEPIRMTTREERVEILKAAVMSGDESYAGSRSFFRFEMTYSAPYLRHFTARFEPVN